MIAIQRPGVEFDVGDCKPEPDAAIIIDADLGVKQRLRSYMAQRRTSKGRLQNLRRPMVTSSYCGGGKRHISCAFARWVRERQKYGLQQGGEQISTSFPLAR